MKEDASRDAEYLRLVLDALGKCRDYRPKFGQGGKDGLSLSEFRTLYSADEFYHWFGLDTPLVYAAHRAAGGITSVYRQIGIGCQWLFQRLLQDTLGLTLEQSTWFYVIPSTRPKERKLSLDARIPLASIAAPDRRANVATWLKSAAAAVGIRKRDEQRLSGAVFEVRQGYKSADSKRQNADIANAANAYAARYLPVVLLFSAQINSAIAERYIRAQWLMLRGTFAGPTTNSTYAFCREVLGFDLAAFFARNSAIIRKETDSILEGLLR